MKHVVFIIETSKGTLEGGERMDKKILGVFASLLVVAILALPMSSAYATPSTTVSFTITVVEKGGMDTYPSGKSDTSIVIKSDWITACTGDIVGGGYFDVREVVRGADKTSSGLYVITGTLDSTKSGTLYIKTSVNTRDPQPSYWRIVSGTDDFANLHGQGTFVFQAGLLFTGKVHFDP